MRSGRKTALLALTLSLALVTGALGAMEKAELINGTHWTKWSEGDRLI
jgi:hypothetical protein